MRTSDEYAKDLAATWAFSDEQLTDIEQTVREATNGVLMAAELAIYRERDAIRSSALVNRQAFVERLDVLARSIRQMKDVRS